MITTKNTVRQSNNPAPVRRGTTGANDMETVRPVKFHIQRDTLQNGQVLFMVIATMSDGRKMAWGDPKTERGVKAVLSRAARAYGFVVTGNTAQAA